MKILITADSTSDLGEELLAETGIKIMPLMVNFEDESFFDGVDINTKDVFERVLRGSALPKSAARGIEEYKEFFNNYLKSGYDAIIHASLSSEISSSYNNAFMASKELSNVYVIDSLQLSSGNGLVALLAYDLTKNDKLTAKQIFEIVEEKKHNISTSFVLSTLKFLCKGGRCSALAAFGANLLKIKPELEMKNGKLGICKKFIGKQNEVLVKYVNEKLRQYPDADKKRIFITYSSKELLDVKLVRKEVEKYGFENIYEVNAGSVISTHSGPNCLGILFITNKNS